MLHSLLVNFIWGLNFFCFKFPIEFLTNQKKLEKSPNRFATDPFPKKQLLVTTAKHCVKSVRIRSYSGLCFPEFGLNTGRYGASLHIQSKCGKIRIRITPNTETFYAIKNNIETYIKFFWLFPILLDFFYFVLFHWIPWN